MHFASRSEKLRTENKIYMDVLRIFKDNVYVHFGDHLGQLVMNNSFQSYKQ